jgi:hypothetical protein
MQLLLRTNEIRTMQKNYYWNVLTRFVFTCVLARVRGSRPLIDAAPSPLGMYCVIITQEVAASDRVIGRDGVYGDGA